MPSHGQPLCYTRPVGCLYYAAFIALDIVWFLFGTIWGWLIILAFILPAALCAVKRRAARNSRIAYLNSLLVNRANADARFELGEIYFSMRRYARAKALLADAYSIRKSERKIVLALADAALAARDPGLALEVLTDAENLDLRDSKDRFYTLRGRARLMLGRTADAKADFRAAVSDNGSNIEARYFLVKALKAMGELAAAGEEAAKLKEVYAGLPPFGKRRYRKWRIKTIFV